MPNDSDRTHIRLLCKQLDDIYQVMKAERRAIACWEEEQDFSILGVSELFSTDIQGYAEQVLFNDSSVSFNSNSVNHLRQLNVFNIDYFTGWYFNNLEMYPYTKEYIEQLDHLRLLLIEYISQRSLKVAA
ncbi:hypothetical protein [Iningainema tapete]|uniref:Uncharacterized protein n=1 Tax=Iningainema tapete BLCC-T55 TaxID=2748662 RepID=A0A8J7CHG4_9CYAN|nr:hypothetical protein [Iningainema tapete]MBD2777615.1 hypothetical protein [Iningainema tapete BLCC-T55]